PSNGVVTFASVIGAAIASTRALLTRKLSGADGTFMPADSRRTPSRANAIRKLLRSTLLKSVLRYRRFAGRFTSREMSQIGMTMTAPSRK
ncbi:MAG: hypothetical protein QOD74_2000, partial [Variibacter sp.]|nr:hypothetical protein [Variibacter sp.]